MPFDKTRSSYSNSPKLGGKRQALGSKDSGIDKQHTGTHTSTWSRGLGKFRQRYGSDKDQVTFKKSNASSYKWFEIRRRGNESTRDWKPDIRRQASGTERCATITGPATPRPTAGRIGRKPDQRGKGGSSRGSGSLAAIQARTRPRGRRVNCEPCVKQTSGPGRLGISNYRLGHRT